MGIASRRISFANTEVKVFTRRGHDWTNRFKKVASDAWHIGAGSAIIDGEIVVAAADGNCVLSSAHRAWVHFIRRVNFQTRRAAARQCLRLF
jgi:hypothetical protein